MFPSDLLRVDMFDHILYIVQFSGKGCNIRIQVPSVAKEHAEVVVKPLGVKILFSSILFSYLIANDFLP